MEADLADHFRRNFWKMVVVGLALGVVFNVVGALFFSPAGRAYWGGGVMVVKAPKG